MRIVLFFGVGILLASQMAACGCPSCFGVGGPVSYAPAPIIDGLDGPRTGASLDGLVAAVLNSGPAPQSAGAAQWSGGPEAALAAAGGSTDFGIGGQAVCEITGQPLGVTGGATLYFPDVGNAYGAWAGYRYNVEGDGPLKLFGVGAATWSHYGYDTDDYEIPDGEFFELGAGGGAAFQQGFGGSGDAFGIRLGGGAQLADENRRVRPYAEAGYDIYLLGDDFDNQFRVGAGVQIPLGGS